MKPTYTCFDHSFLPFGLRSASLGGERRGEEPRHLNWSHNTRQPGNIFYTDQALLQVKGNPHTLEIAWIIEPPWKSGPYDAASHLHTRFDYILTYYRAGAWHPNYLYYPIGGSWIKEKDWNANATKTKSVSVIGTDKKAAPGHRLRHSAIHLFSRRFDVYGRGYNPIKSKLTALAPYRFSLVIESMRIPGYFTEKLIDCMSVGTIPIYWGDPTISTHFNPDGIIQIENLDGFYYTLSNLSPNLYKKMRPAAIENFEIAKRYACVEDWLYTNHHFLFE